jgi:hypothetical protein
MLIAPKVLFEIEVAVDKAANSERWTDGHGRAGRHYVRRSGVSRAKRNVKGREKDPTFAKLEGPGDFFL